MMKERAPTSPYEFVCSADAGLKSNASGSHVCVMLPNDSLNEPSSTSVIAGCSCACKAILSPASCVVSVSRMPPIVRDCNSAPCVTESLARSGIVPPILQQVYETGGTEAGVRVRGDVFAVVG